MPTRKQSAIRGANIDFEGFYAIIIYYQIALNVDKKTIACWYGINKNSGRLLYRYPFCLLPNLLYINQINIEIKD